MNRGFGEDVKGGGAPGETRETIEEIIGIPRFNKLRLTKTTKSGREVVPGELFYLPQQPIMTGKKMVFGNTLEGEQFGHFNSSQVSGIARLGSGTTYEVTTKSGSVYELEILPPEKESD